MGNLKLIFRTKKYQEQVIHAEHFNMIYKFKIVLMLMSVGYSKSAVEKINHQNKYTQKINYKFKNK